MFDLRDWLEGSDAGGPPPTRSEEAPSVPADADAGTATDPPTTAPDPLDSGFDLDAWLTSGVEASPAFLGDAPEVGRPAWRTRARRWSASVPPLTGVAAALFLASIVVLATGFTVPGLVGDTSPDGSGGPAPGETASPTPDTPEGSADADRGDGDDGDDTPADRDTAAPGDAPPTSSPDQGASTPAAADAAERTAQTSPTPAEAATPSSTATPSPSPSPTDSPTPDPAPDPDSTLPDPTEPAPPDDGGSVVDQTVETVTSVVETVDQTVGGVLGSNETTSSPDGESGLPS